MLPIAPAKGAPFRLTHKVTRFAKNLKRKVVSVQEAKTAGLTRADLVCMHELQQVYTHREEVAITRHFAAREWGCDPKTAAARLQRLAAAGFAERVTVGSRGRHHAGEWRLTMVDFFSPKMGKVPTASKRGRKDNKTISTNTDKAEQGVPAASAGAWSDLKQGFEESMEFLQALAADKDLNQGKARNALARLGLSDAEILDRLQVCASSNAFATGKIMSRTAWLLHAVADERMFGDLQAAQQAATRQSTTSAAAQEALRDSVEHPEIQAKLEELGANPAGIASVRSKQACDGPTALRFLTVLPAHWRRHGAPQNKPGWAIAALKNPAFLASVLAQNGGAPKPTLGAKDIPGLREALDRILKAEPAHESPGFFDWLDRRSEAEARLAAAVEATLPPVDREALQAKIRQGIPADLPQDFADRAFRRQIRAALLARST